MTYKNIQFDPDTGSYLLSQPDGGSIQGKIVYVDPVGGNDTTGKGTEGAPYKTIAKALTVIDGSGYTLQLFPGTYAEVVTWTRANTNIIGADVRSGLVALTGDWTFAHTGGSVRVSGVAHTGAVNYMTTANAFYFDSQLTGSFTMTSGGYVEAQRCNMEATSISVTGAAARLIIEGGTQRNIVVNNASAVVSVRNSLSCAAPVLTAGTLSIDAGSLVYSTGATNNAVAAASGSTLRMKDVTCLTPTGIPARISAEGFWSIDDVNFDRTNSVLTGTNVGTEAVFDAVRSLGTATARALAIPYAQTSAYAAAVIVEKDAKLYKSNGAIAANLPFTTGTTGATWTEIAGGGGGGAEGEVTVKARNLEGSTALEPGRLVLFTAGLSGLNVDTGVRIAGNVNPELLTSGPALGVVTSTASVSAGQLADVVRFSSEVEVLTGGSGTDGQPLYMNARTGAVTETAPTTDDHYYLGVVIKQGQASGAQVLNFAPAFRRAGFQAVQAEWRPLDNFALQYNGPFDLTSFSIPSAGRWRVDAQIRMTAALANNDAVLRFVLNGVWIEGGAVLLHYGTGGGFQVTTTTYFEFVTTGPATLDLRVFAANGGGSFAVINDTNGYCRAQIRRVG
jgi:hypothetical protein